jgi:hypothetical protein
MFQIQTPFKEKLKAKTLRLPPKMGLLALTTEGLGRKK